VGLGQEKSEPLVLLDEIFASDYLVFVGRSQDNGDGGADAQSFTENGRNVRELPWS
jgi:hypothetical protein